MDTDTSGSAEKRPTVERKSLKPGKPFDTCTQCGYEKGFHLAPVKGRRSVKAGRVTLLLKCPNCGALYDAGLAAAE